jgi:hypothetical protein
MGRLRTWRYDPPVLPSERRAMRQEVLVLWILVAIMLLATFAEPLMDMFMALLGVR